MNIQFDNLQRTNQFDTPDTTIKIPSMTVIKYTYLQDCDPVRNWQQNCDPLQQSAALSIRFFAEISIKIRGLQLDFIKHIFLLSPSQLLVRQRPKDRLRKEEAFQDPSLYCLSLLKAVSWKLRKQKVVSSEVRKNGSNNKVGTKVEMGSTRVHLKTVQVNNVH